MTERSQGLQRLPMRERAERAMREAYADVIADHRRSGLPLVVLRDGRVVHLQPSPLPVEQWQEVPPPGDGV
jgi:hypothetical protein